MQHCAPNRILYQTDTFVAKIPLLPTTPAASLRLGLNLAIVAALAGLGYASGAGLSDLMQRSLEGASPGGPETRAQASGPSVRSHRPVQAFGAVLTSNIFHARRLDQGTSAAQGPAGAAPSALRLTLRGTFSIGNTAFAIVVGTDGRGEQVYQVGECLPRSTPEPTRDCTPGQGRLRRVELNAITVDYLGQAIVVPIDIQALADQGPNSPQALGGPVINPRIGAPPVPATRTGNTVEMHLPGVEVEKAFENFSDIVRQALVVPFAKDGVNQGFQIQRIQPGSIFQRIGLQNLDVVRGVNGQALNNADQALRLFTVFRNERQVVLDVDRGGESLKLSYTID